jgi:putative drug exporter of the RND superfamily
VRSVDTGLGAFSKPWRFVPSIPRAQKSAVLSDDNRLVLFTVVPKSNLEPFEVAQLARELRSSARAEGLVSLKVGGAPALNADYVDAVARWFVPVAAAICALTFVIFALGLRSVLLPLKAVALNLLSVAAALGAMTLVFQHGLGAGLIGLPGGYGGVFPVIPILVFAVVFGLSTDYEIFLFHRVVEAHRAGAANADAMIIGLRATAWVITSAAALMIVVFAVFTLSEFLFMKMLGFTLAAAILIDSLVIRLLLGPALFAIGGRWNWWPFRSP